jgi:hypothetical protein
MKLKPKLETVRVLSVRQPWASLIVVGDKDIENRSWVTPYRGPLYIHAGLRFDKEGWEDLRENADFYFGMPIEEALPLPGDFVRGAIIGRVVLKDIIEFDSAHPENMSAWHYEGQYGWVLENPEQFAEPIFMNGRLGVFSAEIDTASIRLFE